MSVHAAWLAAVASVLSRYSGAEALVLAVHDDEGPRTIAFTALPGASFAELARQAEMSLAEGSARAANDEEPSPASVQLHLASPATTELRAPLELALWVRVDGEAIRLHADYHAGLFSEAFIGRLLAHLERLLDEGTRALERPIATLPMISDEERHFLVHELNAGAEEYERELCLHQLVERTAKERPGDVAALFPQQSGEVLTLTYRELDERANRLAHLLYREGVRRDEPVGVYARRTPELLCALLGILKAGAAYVPLDPAFPAARLALMSEDAALRFVVCERALERSAPPAARSIVIEEALADETLVRREPPLIEHDAMQLAYVLFTSGSTGRPNGVLVPHRAAVNLLSSMRKRPGFSRADRLLALATLSFDISVLELFLPLVCGAVVVVASREDAQRPARIAHLLEAHDVTVLQATPATWRMLVDDGWRGRSPGANHARSARGLKALCGGEALSQELASALIERTHELWNLYGPTETTVWSTAERVLPGEPISVGRPIDNTRVYVLDEQRCPQPLGVAGALWIGGDGVARGYLAGRQDPTTAAADAERFVSDPFAGAEHARMYRTGDVARLREDGKIELLGREDQQVKLRGYRIELGEIEAALERAPGVLRAVVVARGDEPALRRLVAYLTLDTTAGVSLDEAALERELARSLPDYMIPAAFVPLVSFPLTPNGKMDKRQLPDPSRLRRAPDALLGAPISEDERRLLRLFEETLRLWPLGTDENFFALGGDSLLAVRLCARVYEELSVRLSADALLEAPTVTKLARLLRERDARDAWQVEIQAGDARPPVFCLSGIGGHAIVFRALAARSDPQRRFFGLRWPGLDGAGAPHEDVVELARYFVSKLEESYPGDMPIYLAAYSFGGLVAYEMAVELLARGRAPALLALLDTPGPERSFAGEKLTRLAAHLHNLGKRPLSEKARYALRWLELGLPRLLARSERYYELVEDRGPGRRHLRAMRKAHERALRRYQARPYAGAATLFRALSLPLDVERRQDPRYGWGSSLLGRLDVVELRAPHMEMLHEPYVDRLAPAFRAALTRADASAWGPARSRPVDASAAASRAPETARALRP